MLWLLCLVWSGGLFLFLMFKTLGPRVQPCSHYTLSFFICQGWCHKIRIYPYYTQDLLIWFPAWGNFSFMSLLKTRSFPFRSPSSFFNNLIMLYKEKTSAFDHWKNHLHWAKTKEIRQGVTLCLNKEKRTLQKKIKMRWNLNKLFCHQN